LTGCGASILGPFGNVKGQVVDEGSGNGIGGATVKFAGKPGKSGVTDSWGNFFIEDVEIGQDTITASDAGYMNIGNGQAPVNIEEDSTTNVSDLKLVKITNKAVYLSDMAYVQRDDLIDDEQLQINAIIYYYSIVGYYRASDQECSIEYNIYRLFKRFKAIAGVDDSSPYESQKYKFRVYVDDVLAFESAELGRSEAADINVSVENALRVRLVVLNGGSWEARDGAKYAGFGDPRVTLE
jgi:hypothetical protein